MDNYEKNVDKALNAVEKAGGVANRLSIGCAFIVANLFFMAFCLWGAYAGYASWNLEQNGEATTGVVVELKEQSDGEGGCCTYVPVVEYVVGGQSYSLEGDTASDPPQYAVGEEVPMLYDPSNPNAAQINKWSERWLFPILIIPSMLLAALVVSFFLLRAFRRNEHML